MHVLFNFRDSCDRLPFGGHLLFLQLFTMLLCVRPIVLLLDMVKVGETTELVCRCILDTTVDCTVLPARQKLE